jgi:hypothetical protein
MMTATFYTRDVSPETQQQLIDIVEKGINWAEIAKTNKVDVYKPVIDSPITGIERGTMMVNFQSYDDGQYSVLRFKIEDYNNIFLKDEYYIYARHLPELKRLLESLPSKIKQAQNQTKNEALFN